MANKRSLRSFAGEPLEGQDENRRSVELFLTEFYPDEGTELLSRSCSFPYALIFTRSGRAIKFLFAFFSLQTTLFPCGHFAMDDRTTTSSFHVVRRLTTIIVRNFLFLFTLFSMHRMLLWASINGDALNHARLLPSSIRPRSESITASR